MHIHILIAINVFIYIYMFIYICKNNFWTTQCFLLVWFRMVSLCMANPCDVVCNTCKSLSKAPTPSTDGRCESTSVWSICTRHQMLGHSMHWRKRQSSTPSKSLDKRPPNYPEVKDMVSCWLLEHLRACHFHSQYSPHSASDPHCVSISVCVISGGEADHIHLHWVRWSWVSGVSGQG